MERKIGEIFEYNGEWYQVVECDSCGECSLRATECGSGTKSDLADEVFGECSKVRRSDSRHAIFKKLEKVGEPYTAKNRSTGRTIHFQRYRCYQKPIIEGNIVWHCPGDNFIDIEIKQNKEDINKEELRTIHGKTVKRIKGNCFDCCFYSKGMCELTMKEVEAQNCGMGMIYVEVKQNKEDMEEKAIKIKKEDIEIGNKVICLSNNKPYVITETNCRMKYDGDWHDCVIYTPLYDNPFKCFVRPIEDFAQNFVLDSTEEKEEKHSNWENTGKNLKPFNLEAAKAGKPVCTRDGRKARIICFDAKDTQPIIGLYEKDIDGIVREYLCSYHMDGRMYDDHDCGYDLMMLPEKKEGWVVVSRNEGGYTFVDNNIFDNKESADRFNPAGVKKIAVTKIEWEG